MHQCRITGLFQFNFAVVGAEIEVVGDIVTADFSGSV